MMNILDIDLDFFLDKVPVFVSTDSNDRLQSGSYIPWKKNEVEKFLINQCGLSAKSRIPGKLLNHHDEVYNEVRNLIESETTNKVNIDHVDAHADLGLGDLCYNYLFFNLLREPIQERYYHDEDISNLEKMGPGNYLVFMIACNWVKKLRYIHLDNQVDDLNYLFLKDLRTDSQIVKLRVYCEQQIPDNFESFDKSKFIRETNPCRFEKDVPLETIQYRNFNSDKTYDRIFLTTSPSHTPVESDKLIPVIMQYIEQE